MKRIEWDRLHSECGLWDLDNVYRVVMVDREDVGVGVGWVFDVLCICCFGNSNADIYRILSHSYAESRYQRPSIHLSQSRKKTTTPRYVFETTQQINTPHPIPSLSSARSLHSRPPPTPSSHSSTPRSRSTPHPRQTPIMHHLIIGQHRNNTPPNPLMANTTNALITHHNPPIPSSLPIRRSIPKQQLSLRRNDLAFPQSRNDARFIDDGISGAYATPEIGFEFGDREGDRD